MDNNTILSIVVAVVLFIFGSVISHMLSVEEDKEKKQSLTTTLIVVAIIFVVFLAYIFKPNPLIPENQTKETKVTQGKQKSNLDITSDPSSATITINGKNYDNTPNSIPLDPGTYTIQISKIGYKTTTRAISLTEGKDLPLDITLIKEPVLIENGTVLLTSDPVGANVYIDSVSYDYTPKKVELPPGEHIASFYMRGYKDRNITFTVESGKQKNIIGKLEKLPLPKGTANFTSTPSGALVSVGGSLKGTTPFQAELETGTYSATFSKDGFSTETVSFDISEDSQTNVDATLKQIEKVITITKLETPGSVSGTNQVNHYTYTARVTGRYRFEVIERSSDNSVTLTIKDSINRLIDTTTSWNALTVDLTSGKVYHIFIELYTASCSYILKVNIPNEIKDITSLDLYNDAIRYANQVNHYTYTASVTGGYRFEVIDRSSNNSVILTIKDSINRLIDTTSSWNALSVDLTSGKVYHIFVEFHTATCSYKLKINPPNQLKNKVQQGFIFSFRQNFKKLILL